MLALESHTIHLYPEYNHLIVDIANTGNVNQNLSMFPVIIHKIPIRHRNLTMAFPPTYQFIPNFLNIIAFLAEMLLSKSNLCNSMDHFRIGKANTQ